MKTVRILCGGYGLHLPGKRGVKLVVAGQSVELPDADADALVRDGMAAFVSDSPKFAPDFTAVPDEGAETSVNTGEPENAAEGEKTAFLDPGQFSDMNFAQVKKLAKEMGLDVDGVNTKKALVEMITAVPVDIGDDDDDAPPNLNAEAPVV